jgi:hypothetical protein
MRTSELHKGQPILAFLAPSGANAASFGQPSQRPFHDPTPCGVLLLLRNWFRQWLAATPSVGDMFLIIGFSNENMNIIKIITFVQTKMLFFCRARDHNRNDKVINRPFIMLFSAGKMNRQRGAALVNQDMNLCPAFTAVGRISSSSLSAQRSRHRFTVDSLPFPANPPPPIVKANHCLQDLVPDTLLLPRLEPFMQDTAGNAEPITMNCFPLAACPQNVPEPIDDCPIVDPRTPWPSFLERFGQMLFDAAPQGARDTEIVDTLWLLFILTFQDAPRWTFVFGQTDCPRGASFVQVNLFFG